MPNEGAPSSGRQNGSSSMAGSQASGVGCRRLRASLVPPIASARRPPRSHRGGRTNPRRTGPDASAHARLLERPSGSGDTRAALPGAKASRSAGAPRVRGPRRPCEELSMSGHAVQARCSDGQDPAQRMRSSSCVPWRSLCPPFRPAAFFWDIRTGAFERCTAGLPGWFDENIDTYCLDALNDGSFAALEPPTVASSLRTTSVRPGMSSPRISPRSSMSSCFPTDERPGLPTLQVSRLAVGVCARS